MVSTIAKQGKRMGKSIKRILKTEVLFPSSHSPVGEILVTLSAPPIVVPILFSMLLHESVAQAKSLPASIPTAEPITAWTQMSGEEINKAIRKIPPVQGLSQP